MEFQRCCRLLVIFLNLALKVHMIAGQSIVSGILEPLTKHVLIGDTAEFTCDIAGRDPPGEPIQWVIQNQGDDSRWFIEVTSSATILVNGDDLPNGWNFNAAYNQENENELFSLCIANITAFDGRYFDVNCAHERKFLSGDWAKLTIWTAPSSPPHCSFEIYDLPTIIPNGQVYLISLRCRLNDGEPVPALVWYTTEQDRYRMIGNRVTNDNTVTQQITSTDHGRRYTCEASIGAFPDDPLTCSVIPYNPVPILSLIPSDTLIIKHGEAVSIECNNTGVSTPNTTYAWYINNVLQNGGNDAASNIRITQMAASSSKIIIANTSLLSNNTRISCEGSIPFVARANASLTVVFLRDESPDGPAVSSTDSSIPIIAGSAAGGFAIIIGIIAFICCRYYKQADTDRTTDEQSTISKTAYITDKESQKTTQESTQLSPDGMPIYALPDKAKQNSHLAQKPSDYEDVQGSHNHGIDGIDLATIASHTGKGRNANIEDIAYADLELTQTTYANNVIDDRDGSTLYSEVKV